MPDITSVLERAAARPTQGPDLARARRSARRVRVGVGIGIAAAIAVVGSIAALVILRSPARSRVTVATNSTPSSTTPSPTTVTSGDASISVEPGWYVSSKPLTPWLVSPHELFSIATVPLDPSPQPGNQAACASEIAKVAVDGIGARGAYLWIGEWPNDWPYNRPSARPATSAGLHLDPGCVLPHGLKSYLALLRDGDHEYSVTYVLGPEAPATRVREIDRMLDSLRFRDHT